MLHNWLWTGENFGTHNIGLWYEEVDCNDPFEEEYGCLENKVAFKKMKPSSKEKSLSTQNLIEKNYYDVLGRTDSPFFKQKNRKILYGKEKLNENMEYILNFKEELILANSSIISGFVVADIKVILVNDKILKKDNGRYVHLCKMQIITDVREINYSMNNAIIIQHEREHERIFEIIKFVEWEEEIFTNALSIENQCEEIKDKLWFSAKEKIEPILILQNEWDETDMNNICTERINVKSTMVDIKNEFYSNIPCKPCRI